MAKYTNLGHSYLLRGEWGKAKQVYKQYIANEKDPAETKATSSKSGTLSNKQG